jgi:hypothetical protein
VQVDNLTDDTAAIKSALTLHGGAFNLRQQDVRQLRGEVRGLTIGSKPTSQPFPSLLLREACRLWPPE